MPSSIRMVGTAVLAIVLLSGPVAGQEPATVDVFAGGGGLAGGEGGGFELHAGGGVWATERLRIGALARSGALFGLLSVHLRLPIGSDTSLLVGATPLWYVYGEFVGYPEIDTLVSRRIAPRLRVEAGAAFDYHYLLRQSGGHIQVLGRMVYSFD